MCTRNLSDKKKWLTPCLMVLFACSAASETIFKAAVVSSKSELSRSYQEAVCSRVLEFKATDKYYHQCKVSPSQAPRRGPETFEVSHPIIAIMSDPAAQTDPVRVIGDKDSLCWSIFINLMVQIFLFLSVLPDSTKRDFGINISQIYGHLDIVGFLRVCFCCA